MLNSFIVLMRPSVLLFCHIFVLSRDFTGFPRSKILHFCLIPLAFSLILRRDELIPLV